MRILSGKKDAPTLGRSSNLINTSVPHFPCIQGHSRFMLDETVLSAIYVHMQVQYMFVYILVLPPHSLHIPRRLI